MTSTATPVTRIAVTRSPGDIEPKVIAAACAQAVVTLVGLALFLGHAITVDVLAALAGPGWLAVVAGYVKRTTHGALDVPVVLEQAKQAAPIIEALAPDATPAAEKVVEGIDYVQEQLADSGTPTSGATASLTKQ